MSVTEGYGRFEVRTHPITDPDVVQVRYGYADQGINDWYVVINNNSRVDAAWEWGYGLSWFHPDPDVQPPYNGTFDQILTPADDAARAIVKLVKEQNGV